VSVLASGGDVSAPALKLLLFAQKHGVLPHDFGLLDGVCSLGPRVSLPVLAHFSCADACGVASGSLRCQVGQERAVAAAGIRRWAGGIVVGTFELLLAVQVVWEVALVERCELSISELAEQQAWSAVVQGLIGSKQQRRHAVVAVRSSHRVVASSVCQPSAAIASVG
jgi:hypothetical protein